MKRPVRSVPSLARAGEPTPSLRARALLVDLGRYPEQATSWSAVYHVLQRYGGYVALVRFGNVFDSAGAFR